MFFCSQVSLSVGWGLSVRGVSVSVQWGRVSVKEGSLSRGALSQRPPPGTLEEWAVRILLECILVHQYYRSIHTYHQKSSISCHLKMGSLMVLFTNNVEKNQRCCWHIWRLIEWRHLLCLSRTTARSGQLAHITTNMRITMTKVPVFIAGGDTTNWNTATKTRCYNVHDKKATHRQNYAGNKWITCQNCSTFSHGLHWG